MLLNCVIIWTLLQFVQTCIMRNHLFQYSYNVQNQPNIIPLGLLFNGSSLQFSIINNNNTQGYKIYQSVDLLQTYYSVIDVSQVVASSQFPIITNAQVQIQFVFLTLTQSTYQLYMTTWQSSSINTSYQFLNTIENQQNCNRVVHLNQNEIVILCKNQLGWYNMTSNAIIYSQISWPTFTISYYWLKAINDGIINKQSQDTVYVSFSDGSSNFTSTSYVNTNGQFVKVNVTNYDGIVTGFDVYPDNTYFILRNSILSYFNKNTQINCNITFSSQSFLSIFSGLNKLGQAHFYIAVINQTILTQFIFNTDNSLFGQPFQQSFPPIDLSQQPQLSNDQYYFVIQFGSNYEVFNGYENQQIGISPLYFQQVPQNSLVIYITYSDQILIQTVTQASLNQVNQPILVFEKPKLNVEHNFIYTIQATGAFSTLDTCFQNFQQKSISAQFNQVQQYQNCSQINADLYNPQIKQIDVGYCALGPNITYQAGTFVNIEGLAIDQYSASIEDSSRRAYKE